MTSNFGGGSLRQAWMQARKAVRAYVSSGSTPTMPYFNFGRVQARCRDFLFKIRSILTVRSI